MRRIRAFIKFLLFIVVLAGCGLLYAQYKVSQLSFPPLKIGDSSVIFASDGKTELGHIASAGKNHVSLTDEQVSPLLRQAHMAAEDRSFYVHGPISLPGMAFALLKDATHLSITAGGSTITQQYVKNAYLTQDRTLDRKTDEITYSYKVEKEFSKDQILTKYVNSNYYGRGAYGVEDAAQVWFGVSAAQLNDMNDPLQVARAAFLAALVRQPSTFATYEGKPSNLVNKKSLYERVNYVLDGLTDVKGVPKMVPPDVIAKAKQLLPLEITDTVGPGGTTLDGDPYLVDYARAWLTAWQIEVAKSDGRSDDVAQKEGAATAEAMLTRGGMHIVTTLDANLQHELATAVAAELPHRGLSAGAVIQNPRDGGIVAMYGGNNHDTDQFNYALYANRQVGSVMKTVVVSDAVSHDISMQSVLPAPAYIQMNGSKIYNDDRSAAPGCQLKLTDAVAQSNNPVHIELITGQMASCDNPAHLTPIAPGYPVSPASVAALARKMGADDSLVPGATNPAQLDEVPTLALGVSSLTVPKVATIGSTLASGGVHTKPYLVVRINASSGTATYEHEAESTRVLDAKYAYTINQVLTGVFTHGTGRGAQVPSHPMAGKTGTTNSDAWGLMYSAVDPNGQTPAYVCAAWAGYPDNRQTNGDLWGAGVMKICQHFMIHALSGTPRVDFPAADLNAGRIVGLNANNGVSATAPVPSSTTVMTTTMPPAPLSLPLPLPVPVPSIIKQDTPSIPVTSDQPTATTTTTTTTRTPPSSTQPPTSDPPTSTTSVPVSPAPLDNPQVSETTTAPPPTTSPTESPSEVAGG